MKPLYLANNVCKKTAGKTSFSLKLKYRKIVNKTVIVIWIKPQPLINYFDGVSDGAREVSEEVEFEN